MVILAMIFIAIVSYAIAVKLTKETFKEYIHTLQTEISTLEFTFKDLRNTPSNKRDLDTIASLRQQLSASEGRLRYYRHKYEGVTPNKNKRKQTRSYPSPHKSNPSSSVDAAIITAAVVSSGSDSWHSSSDSSSSCSSSSGGCN